MTIGKKARVYSSSGAGKCAQEEGGGNGISFTPPKGGGYLRLSGKERTQKPRGGKEEMSIRKIGKKRRRTERTGGRVDRFDEKVKKARGSHLGLVWDPEEC